MLGEGTEISRNLRELAASLRNNAERLLRDVRLTHGAMTARLDQVSSNGERPSREDAHERNGDEPTATARGRRRRGEGGGGESNDDLDVPEFIPRG